MIILLNGCPSSGKSSIAKELQKIHDKPLLHTGIDHFWKMIPDQYKEFGSQASEGYSFVQSVDNENKSVIYVKKGSFAQRLDNTLAHVIKCLVDCGHDVVADVIFVPHEMMYDYAHVLQNYQVYLVGIMCDLSELERRKKARNDRELGLARGAFDNINIDEECYDVIVDSAQYDATTCAQKIMNYIQKNPDPQGLKKLLNHI